jgi:EmrB/QacA subfamily drug resistance transporter
MTNTTPTPNGRWILVATITASSMAFIASTVLNLASVPLRNELGADGVDLLWIINLFTLLLAALILLGGSLGDHFGRVRVFGAGIVLFGIGSIVGGIAPSVEIMLIGRAIMGIGGAAMVPGSLAIITATFSQSERGTAIGTWSSISTIASVIGPVFGGFLVDNGFWRGLFFINLPLIAIALYALRYVPESRDEEAPRQIDVVGAVLITVSLAGLTYGTLELGRRVPETTTQAVIAVIVGIVTLIAFAVWETRTPTPMVKPSLFNSRTFTGANLLTLLLYGGMAAALFFLPLNLTQVQRYPSTIAGAAMLPTTLLIALLSPYAGRWASRLGVRQFLIAGPVIVGIAFLLLSAQGVTAGPESYWTTFFPVSVVLGLGLGLTVAPLTTAVMTSVPSHEAGIASGINNAITRASQGLATAIFGAVLLALFSTVLTGRITDLPADAQQAMIEESANLGNTPIPESLSEEQRGAADAAIREGFVDAMRPILIIATVMAWGSAAAAAVFVERKKP